MPNIWARSVVAVCSCLIPGLCSAHHWMRQRLRREHINYRSNTSKSVGWTTGQDTVPLTIPRSFCAWPRHETCCSTSSARMAGTPERQQRKSHLHTTTHEPRDRVPQNGSKVELAARAVQDGPLIQKINVFYVNELSIVSWICIKYNSTLYSYNFDYEQTCSIIWIKYVLCSDVTDLVQIKVSCLNRKKSYRFTKRRFD